MSDSVFGPVPIGAVTGLNPVGTVPNANAATITGNRLTLQPADATHPGVVSVTTPRSFDQQAFGGDKTTDGAWITYSCFVAAPTSGAWMPPAYNLDAAYFSWNRAGNLETNFINSRYVGRPGGWTWWDYESNSTIYTQAMALSAAGALAPLSSLDLPATTDATHGVIRQASVPVMHSGAGNTNFFAGANAGVNTTNAISLTGTDNVGVGAGAARMLSTGTLNGAFGRGALSNATTGSRNTACGTQALAAVMVGTDNTAVGYLALNATSGGITNSCALGSGAGGNVTSASFSISIGYQAYPPSASTNGGMSIGNIIYGFANTGTGTTPSTGRIAIGTLADDGTTRLQVAGNMSVTDSVDLPNTTASTLGVVRFGGNPVLHNFGVINLFLGGGGNFTLTGQSNVVCGLGASSLTTGGSNVLVGRGAGNLINTGNNNVCLGRNSGNIVTTANSCIAIGFGAYPPSASADGGMSIGNIIYGFANSGTATTPSTGRIAIGTLADDGVTRLQIAGSIVASGFGSVLVAKGVVTVAVAIDWTASCIQTFTETSLQNPVVTMTAPQNPGNSLFLKIVAPATGTSPTITWPATVKGAPPTTVTLAKISMLEFVWDGTNYYYMSGCLNV